MKIPNLDTLPPEVVEGIEIYGENLLRLSVDFMIEDANDDGGLLDEPETLAQVRGGILEELRAYITRRAQGAAFGHGRAAGQIEHEPGNA